MKTELAPDRRSHPDLGGQALGRIQPAAPGRTGRRGTGWLAARILTKRELDRFLAQTISRLRWGTIAALLLISLLQPSAGRGPLPEWVLVAMFGGYNLLVEVVRRRLPGRHSIAWMAVLDLPAVGLVYFGCLQPGGPLFTLLVLAAAQTTAFMTLAGGFLYTVALAAIVLVVEPTFPLWAGTLSDMRGMIARIVVLGVVGVGMGTLTRRLDDEQTAARTMLDEATRLEELDRLRGDFIASVSHDLRTPLTASRAALVLLTAIAGNRLPADERGLLDNARRNVERLGILIDDLLTYNQLEAGTVRLDREPIDLRAVVTEAMAAVHPLVHANHQTLALELPEPLPCEGDAARLEQVFLNLLANAQRHTSAGTSILIRGEAGTEEILVSVRDTGPGIPSAELEAIFGRFYRLSGRDGGSGLGLAIARGIVELHGGRIWAESGPGDGATFRVALPRSRPGGAP